MWLLSSFINLAFTKLCRVIVPGDTDCLSFGADSFKYEGHNFIDEVFIKAVVLHENVILDIVLDDFLVNIKMRSVPFPFASVPAAVPRPLRERDLENGKEWNGYLIYLYLIFLLFGKSVFCISFI